MVDWLKADREQISPPHHAMAELEMIVVPPPPPPPPPTTVTCTACGMRQTVDIRLTFCKMCTTALPSPTTDVVLLPPHPSPACIFTKPFQTFSLVQFDLVLQSVRAHSPLVEDLARIVMNFLHFPVAKDQVIDCLDCTKVWDWIFYFVFFSEMVLGNCIGSEFGQSS